MWHAFDIIAEELAIPDELRAAQPGAGRRLVYGERVVRWFTDKSGEGQWPAVVDRQPGIVVQRPGVATGAGSDWTLDAEHTRMQGTSVTLRIQAVCAADPWRSLRQWDAGETLGNAQLPSPLGATTERARGVDGKLTRQVSGDAGRSFEQVFPAVRPACLYALLADFPMDELESGRMDDEICDALFTEGMLHMGAASFTRGAPGGAAGHALAEGLRCYTLSPQRGFPLQFWVNRHGLVVYLIEAATRAWTIEHVEALP
jgi:hypothetical protein